MSEETSRKADIDLLIELAGGRKFLLRRMIDISGFFRSVGERKRY